MRTVHETEALRPSDPVPKSMQPISKPNRLKLIIKQQPDDRPSGLSQSPAPNRDPPSYADFSNPLPGSDVEAFTPLTTESGFTDAEVSRCPKELWRLLRRQLHWAESESELLRQECEMTEAQRNKEWMEKEILLDQVIKNELDWHSRRESVLATLPSVEEMKALTLAQMNGAVGPQRPESGMGQREDQREAAAVLASLHQV